MQSFLALKTKLRAEMWPDGEAQNLFQSHNKLFVECLIDLQKWVACFQYNNLQIYNPCSILFQCGESVLIAPERAQIFRVSTYDQINSETCREDADSPTNWCSEVVYKYVEYCRLRKIMERMTCSSFLGQSCGYPVPTNEAYAGFPELPLGFNYPQASLDRSCTSILANCCTPRARAGIWSYESGRIYLSPWLQSTERVIVQWQGVRRTWVDSDLCIDFADYEAAIKAYVLWRHYRDYERDPQQAAEMERAYNMERMSLIHDCREETRDHTCEPLLASQSLATLQGQSTGTLPPDTTSETIFQFSACSVSQNNGSSGVVTVQDEDGNVVGTGSIYCSCAGDVCTNTAYQLTLVTGGIYQYQVLVTDGDGNQSTYLGDFVAEDHTAIGVQVTTTTTSTATTTSTTTAAPAPATLINIDFTNVSPSIKSGFAATGVTSGDFWNAYIPAQMTTPLALQYSNSTASPAFLTKGALYTPITGTNGNSDAMINRFLRSTGDDDQMQFSITGLPAGIYDFYLYGWSDKTGIAPNGCPNGRSFVPIVVGSQVEWLKTGSNNSPLPWVQAPPANFGTCPNVGNYAKATGVVLAAGQAVALTLLGDGASGSTAIPCISGLQIVRVG